jgi:hypothetical protein
MPYGKAYRNFGAGSVRILAAWQEKEDKNAYISY